MSVDWNKEAQQDHASLIGDGRLCWRKSLEAWPSSKNPRHLLDVVACHTEVNRVGGGGELRGRGIKRIMNAAVMGTKFENAFKVDSA